MAGAQGGNQAGQEGEGIVSEMLPTFIRVTHSYYGPPPPRFSWAVIAQQHPMGDITLAPMGEITLAYGECASAEAARATAEAARHGLTGAAEPTHKREEEEVGS